jgi:hypothetical protein
MVSAANREIIVHLPPSTATRHLTLSIEHDATAGQVISTVLQQTSGDSERNRESTLTTTGSSWSLLSNDIGLLRLWWDDRAKLIPLIAYRDDLITSDSYTLLPPETLFANVELILPSSIYLAHLPIAQPFTAQQLIHKVVDRFGLPRLTKDLMGIPSARSRAASLSTGSRRSSRCSVTEPVTDSVKWKLSQRGGRVLVEGDLFSSVDTFRMELDEGWLLEKTPVRLGTAIIKDDESESGTLKAVAPDPAAYGDPQVAGLFQGWLNPVRPAPPTPSPSIEIPLRPVARSEKLLRSRPISVSGPLDILSEHEGLQTGRRRATSSVNEDGEDVDEDEWDKFLVSQTCSAIILG